MKSEQGSQLAALRAAHGFLEENATRLPRVVGTGVRLRLSEIVAELDALVADQAASALKAQGATQSLHVLRRDLVQDHMALISRMARVARERVPEIEPFRLPKGDPSVEKLDAAARGMAAAAKPYAQVFTSAGMPDDFVERLVAAAEAMIDTELARTQHRARMSGATKAIKARLSDGRRIVSVLDAMVCTATRDDTRLSAEWHSVQKVHARIGRPVHRALAAEDASRRVLSITASVAGEQMDSSAHDDELLTTQAAPVALPAQSADAVYGSVCSPRMPDRMLPRMEPLPLV